MGTPELTALSIKNSPTQSPKVNEGAKARIAQNRALRAQGMTASEARKAIRSGTTPTIPADTLMQNVPDVTLTAPKTPVQGSALMGEIEASTDQFTQNLQAKRQEAETGKATSLDKYIQALQGRQGFEGLSLKAEEEAGVAPLEQELNEINNQILREQMALRRATERIEKEGGGLAGGAQAEIQNLERESFAKQADLSIIQMAKQGQYDSAKAIADRKAKAMFEQEENFIEALKFDYTENKELFSTAEQREFDVAFQDRERKLNDEKERVKQISDLAIDALQNGAPTALVQQMQTAETVEEAIGIGGQYVGALERQMQQAQLANIYDQIQSRQTALREEALKAQTEQEKLQKEKEADADQALSIKTLASDLLETAGLSSAVGFGLKKSAVARTLSGAGAGALSGSLLGPVGTLAGTLAGGAGGFFAGGEAISGTARADFEAKASRLSNLLTLDNLKLMSGVLTDKDIDILASAGSNLGKFNISEKTYKEELNRIINVMDRTITNNGITPEQAQFWGVMDNNDLETFNSLWESL